MQIIDLSRNTLVLVLSVALSVSLPSFSHEPIRGVDASQMTDTKDILEIAHETIEGDSQSGRLNSLKESLNFKKKVIESIRVNNQFNQYSGKDIMIDSLILFSMSHSLEMASGPLLVSYGSMMGWDPSLLIGIGVTGAIISIPGLDPLCWLVFYTYAKSKNLRKVVKSVRTLVSIPISVPLKYANSKLKVTEYVKSRIPYVSHMAKLSLQRQWQKQYYNTTKNEAHYVYRYMLNPFQAMEMDVVSKNGELYLSKLSIPKSAFDYGYDKKRLNEWLKPFGWNIKNFVTSNMEYYSKYQKFLGRTYVKTINGERNWSKESLNKPGTEWFNLEIVESVIKKSRKLDLKYCPRLFKK